MVLAQPYNSITLPYLINYKTTASSPLIVIYIYVLSRLHKNARPIARAPSSAEVCAYTKISIYTSARRYAARFKAACAPVFNINNGVGVADFLLPLYARERKRERGRRGSRDSPRLVGFRDRARNGMCIVWYTRVNELLEGFCEEI